MRKYASYLFDADGTLFDTTELIYRCFQNTARVFGKDSIERDQVIGHIGLTLRDQMNVYFGPLSDSMFEEYRDAHMDYQLSIYRDHLALFEGVRETLEELCATGSTCAVVTSRMRPTLDIFLKETGIDQFFSVLVTPECTQGHKPDPAPAYHALHLLKSEASEALFVGDATFDIECGHNAGMETAFVDWSNNQVSSLRVSPTYILNDMRQLCDRT